MHLNDHTKFVEITYSNQISIKQPLKTHQYYSQFHQNLSKSIQNQISSLTGRIRALLGRIWCKRVRRNETGSSCFEFDSSQPFGLESERNRPNPRTRPEPKSPAAAPDRAFRRLRPRRPSAMAPTAPPRREESNGGSHSRCRGPYAAGELGLYPRWWRSSSAAIRRRRP